MFSNRKKFKINGKDRAHKKALVKSLSIELIRNKKIKTTPKKAKVLKQHFDKLVTKVKKENPRSDDQVIGLLGNNRKAFDGLVKIVKENLMDRNSGYTRVIKTLNRPGDNAEQAYIMIVNHDFDNKKSKISELLEQQDQAKEDKSIGNRVKKAVKRNNK